MGRLYIENDNAKITVREGILLDLELATGEKYEGLSARRLFPISNINNYITLLDAERKEVALIRNIETLSKESFKAVQKVLDEYYFVPKIERFISVKNRNGRLKFTVITDHGECTFEVRDYARNIKMTDETRVFFKDTNDNRYEIQDLTKIEHGMVDVYLL